MADSTKKTFYSRMIQKNDTSANWAASDLVPEMGEMRSKSTMILCCAFAENSRSFRKSRCYKQRLQNCCLR